MRCPACGREAREGAGYCESCGTPLVQQKVVASPIVWPNARREMPRGLFLVIAGIVVGVIGGILYAVAFSEAMDSVANWGSNPSDIGTNPFGAASALLILSYAVIGIGTILLFLGLILLVLNE